MLKNCLGFQNFVALIISGPYSTDLTYLINFCFINTFYKRNVLMCERTILFPIESSCEENLNLFLET
ncbi:unnamed protein product [Tenebrio molitor]|nr:unnamed protein product [Tenebrio molitor]